LLKKAGRASNTAVELLALVGSPWGWSGGGHLRVLLGGGGRGLVAVADFGGPLVGGVVEDHLLDVGQDIAQGLQVL